MGGGMILPNVLMIAGAVVWLAGELWGVFWGPKGKIDTTSGWAWWLEKKFPIARVFLGVFLLSLFGHVMFGWTLLP